MPHDPSPTPRSNLRGGALALAGALLIGATACSSSMGTQATMAPAGGSPLSARTAPPPSPDPRIGLGAGLMDAEEAIWNMRKVSSTPPSADFVGVTNSDLAFTGNYVIQGNYNGFQVWDISNPARPTLITWLRLPGVAERRVGLPEPAVRLR